MLEDKTLLLTGGTGSFGNAVLKLKLILGNTKLSNKWDAIYE